MNRDDPRNTGRYDACFDDAALLAHVPTIIARLDALDAGAAP